MDVIKKLDEAERTLRILAANPLGPTAHRHIREAAAVIRAATMTLRTEPRGQCRSEFPDADTPPLVYRCELDAGHDGAHSEGGPEQYVIWVH